MVRTRRSGRRGVGRRRGYWLSESTFSLRSTKKLGAKKSLKFEKYTSHKKQACSARKRFAIYVFLSFRDTKSPFLIVAIPEPRIAMESFELDGTATETRALNADTRESHDLSPSRDKIRIFLLFLSLSLLLRLLVGPVYLRGVLYVPQPDRDNPGYMRM